MSKISEKLLKQKPIRLIVIAMLALFILAPAILSHEAAAQTNGYYDKSFAWDYEGKHWTWNMSIPKALYDSYKAVPDSIRTRNGPAGYGFLTTTKDYYIQYLAKKLNETTTKLGYGSYDSVSFVLAFVQSLPYTSDNVTTGYDEFPRFPIETLVDDGGDCEDTSILFASLTLSMGYGTVYINPPNHYAVGILGNDLHGSYWTYPEGSNKTYYYSETTGDGFTIGQLPDEFQNQKAYIYPIDESKQFVSDVQVAPTNEPSPEPTNMPLITSTPSPINPTTSLPSPLTEPSVQPPKPLSINLIADNPVLFVLFALAVFASIAITVWSIRRPRQQAESLTTLQQPSVSSQEGNAPFEDQKFCIFCGSSNKTHAAYCEKCGKQIG